jgi:P-type Cu2+ transporter
MDYMTHKDNGQETDPHAGHKMSDIQATHDRHAGHSVAMFRDKFWLSFALTIPVVFWSTDVQHWLGYTAPRSPAQSLFHPSLGQSSSFMAASSSFAGHGANLPTTSQA